MTCPSDAPDVRESNGYTLTNTCIKIICPTSGQFNGCSSCEILWKTNNVYETHFSAKMSSGNIFDIEKQYIPIPDTTISDDLEGSNIVYGWALDSTGNRAIY